LTLQLQVPSDGFAQIRGTAYKMPVATAGLVIGGLTLAGAPLTAGFAPYWQLLRSMADVDLVWLVLLVVGGLGVTIGYLRGVQAALSYERYEGSQAAVGKQVSIGEPWPLLIIIALLGITSVVLGFNPSLLIDSLQAVSAGVTFPIR
jgi:formate hydrogenlyase subunit 3/multisubunit Na+/H+ antiporter MnhD subunit